MSVRLGVERNVVVVMVELLSHVQLFAAPWTVARQAPLSMGFPRQEYWIGMPFPSPGDPPDPGTEPTSPAWQADSLPLSHLGSPWRGIQVFTILCSHLFCVFENFHIRLPGGRGGEAGRPTQQLASFILYSTYPALSQVFSVL